MLFLSPLSLTVSFLFFLLGFFFFFRPRASKRCSNSIFLVPVEQTSGVDRSGHSRKYFFCATPRSRQWRRIFDIARGLLSLSLSLMGKRHCFCARGARGSETNAWGSLFAFTVAQTCSRQLVVCLMCALFLPIVCSPWHSSFARARRRHSRFHRHMLLCYFGGLLLFASSCLCV